MISAMLMPPSGPKPARSPQAARHRARLGHRRGRERRRLAWALLLSLLIHTLLLSLISGGQGLGLPGFGLPWQDRRVEVPELRVVLAAVARVAPEAPAVTPGAAPPQQAALEQPVAGDGAPTPSVSLESPVQRTADAVVPRDEPASEALPKANAAATDAADAKAISRADGSGDAAPPPIPRPDVIALDRLEAPAWVVPPASTMPTPVIAAAPSASSLQTEMAASRDAGDASAKLEAERQQAARQVGIRQEAALQEAAREQAARVEAAGQEAERQEAARQATARQEAARADAAQEAAARREAARRAMGRQLDEEAAQRDAASAAARLPSALAPASSGTRRGRLFGRTDPNAELVLYAESWARKIQLNPTFEMVREAAKQPHTNPMVTVAIRSDGSVESVTFVLSSGVAEIDEAIRRIVQSQVPYPRFPPGLAREFDVIEVRRTWYFDMAVRLY